MSNFNEESGEEIPLIESDDIDILMHRDAHFNGSFDTMLAYYKGEGKGMQPVFRVERIEELLLTERALKKNLAALYFTEGDIEKLDHVKESYKALRALANAHADHKSYAQLIAELILAEAEEPTAEIDAIVHSGHTIVKSLIELLHSENFADPLFPGYGYGPQLAAECLGKIGDKSAIIALFEGIGEGDFYQEERTLKALTHIGEPAKAFLLKVLQSRPITYDNERAALALALFKHDDEIFKACLNQLEDPQALASVSFATHLVLACEGMQDPSLKQRLEALLQHPKLPKMIKRDIEAVLHKKS